MFPVHSGKKYRTRNCFGIWKMMNSNLSILGSPNGNVRYIDLRLRRKNRLETALESPVDTSDWECRDWLLSSGSSQSSRRLRGMYPVERNVLNGGFKTPKKGNLSMCCNP